MTTPWISPNLDFFGHAVDASMTLDLLREFATRVEAMLVDGASRPAAACQPLPDSVAAVAGDHEYLYAEVFPALLHESFVISAVVFLERECREYVDTLARALASPLTMRDLNGSVLDRFRTFCSKVASLDLGISQELWQSVDGLVALRNCLIHAGGFVEGSRDRKPVEQFIHTHRTPELSDGRITCALRTSELVSESLRSSWRLSTAQLGGDFPEKSNLVSLGFCYQEPKWSFLKPRYDVPEQHDIEIRKNVEFGVHDDVVLTGDYYAPPGAGPYPALIALHGGFWKRGTAEGYQYWGSYLAEHGYVLFSINYRLVEGTRNRYPAAVHDTRAAVQFMRNKATALKADPKRIGCIGDSAGAHLAALVALTGDAPLVCTAYASDPYAGSSTKVKVVVGVYGAYDLLAQWQHDQVARPRDQVTEIWLGKSPMESKQLFYEASPLTYTTIDNNQTAFLIVWGEDDIVDPRSQSEVFVTALKQAGFFVRTVIVPGAPHFWMWDPIDEPTSYTGFLAPGFCASCRISSNVEPGPDHWVEKAAPERASHPERSP